jgi:hypothetical protein
MMIVFVIVLGIVIAIWVSASARHPKSEAEIRTINRAAEAELKVVNGIERCLRIRVIAGMLQGQKCKGCATIVKRDELDEAGEDSRGRPILLCKKCRNLIGLE